MQQFQKDHVEPLHQDLDAVSKVGEGLVRSAAPGVSTTMLEAELADLNDRWTKLNEKVQTLHTDL